jgi:hypothetical protein
MLPAILPNAVAKYLNSILQLFQCMVDADCTFNPFPAAHMTCCNSGRDFKTCHFICNAMIRSELGKGNLINHVTATIDQAEKGQSDMVNGITIAEEVGKGNMVGGVTIAEEIGQGNMVNGITIAEEVGKGNMVGGVTIAEEIGQGNMVNGITIAEEVGKGNMVGGVTIAEEIGQGNMINGITIAEEVGKGNMVGGVTIAEVGQGNNAGGNMVNGITVPEIGQGNQVNRMTASIGQGEKGQNNMVNGITIAEEIGQGNMVNGVTIPSVNTRRTSSSSSSPAVDGHEPVARVRVQSDYTLGRYKSILSGMRMQIKILFLPLSYYH